VISWTPGGGDVDGHKVYRNETEIANTPIGVTTYTDLIVGTYGYSVRGYSNECGNGEFSVTDSGTSRTAAGVPSGLTAGPVVCDSVVLSWTASTGDVTQYYIYRDAVRVDSVAVTHYADHGVDDATDHFYRVTAMNPACGESDGETITSHARALVELENAVPGTVSCSTSVHLQLSHCEGVLQDSFFLSMNGGPFEPFWGESPPVSDAWIPIYNPGPAQPNTRLMIVSDRTPRYDTLITDPFVVDSCISPVGDFGRAGIPDRFYLDPNYPNPFNPSTVIRFGVAQTAEVRIDVFDVMGRLIATPVLGTWMPGVHEVTWDCAACPSGMYVVRMQAAGHVLMGKMLLMK